MYQIVVDRVVDSYFVVVETSCFPGVEAVLTDAAVAVVPPLAVDTAAASVFTI